MLFFLYIYIIDRNGIKLPVKLIFRLINTQELVYLFDIGPLKMLAQKPQKLEEMIKNSPKPVADPNRQGKTCVGLQ